MHDDRVDGVYRGDGSEGVVEGDEARETSVTGVVKEREGGGEEGKDVTIAGWTNNEQGRIGLLSQWTMEG